MAEGELETDHRKTHRGKETTCNISGVLAQWMVRLPTPCIPKSFFFPFLSYGTQVKGRNISEVGEEN